MSATIRKAQPLDAGAVGAILSEFAATTPWMPKLHSGAEDIGFAAKMIDAGWVEVACQDVADQYATGQTGQVKGFLAQRAHEVLCLYLTPSAQGQGIGKALLDLAKTRSAHLQLCTFAMNTGAQRFYLREGFVETGRTDSHGNDEGLPDISYEWHRSVSQDEEPAT